MSGPDLFPSLTMFTAMTTDDVYCDDFTITDRSMYVLLKTSQCLWDGVLVSILSQRSVIIHMMICIVVEDRNSIADLIGNDR